MSHYTRSIISGIALLMMGLSLISAVTLTVPGTVRADPGVLYAAPTAQGSGDCSDWANACTLQTALTDASNGDEIWVMVGVHYPGSNRDDHFTLDHSGVALYGGFAGTETSRDQRDWQANVTVLSGDIDQNDINNDGNFIAETWNDIQGANAYHVVTGSGTDETAVLDGFVVTAGQANGDGYPHIYGDGMFNYATSPTLTNLNFSGNMAVHAGGGMTNWGSSPTLTNVTISGNSGGNNGGGMANWHGSNPTLIYVTLSGNTAYEGGGMHNAYSSSPTLTSVTFSGNSAGASGGGMHNAYSSNPTLSNVTFSGNSAGAGGGMFNLVSSSPMLTEVSFSGNTANNGGGMYNWEGSNPTLSKVSFSGNTADVGGGGGGGMYNGGSSPTLSNVSFSGNMAGVGGGMYNWNGSMLYRMSPSVATWLGLVAAGC